MAKFQPLVMETMTKSKDGFLGVGVLRATTGINTSGGLGTAPGICWEGFAVTGSSLPPSAFQGFTHSAAPCPIRTPFLGGWEQELELLCLSGVQSTGVTWRVPLSSVTHILES